MRPGRIVRLALGAAFAAATGEPAAPVLRAWPVDALVKVFPGDRAPASPAPEAEIVAARNQHVALQVALRSASRLEAVTAECRPLVGPGGTLAADVRLLAVGLVVVGNHTDGVPADELVGEAPGFYPDPLLDLPLALEAGRTRAVWVSIHIPTSGAPGAYRSAVVVRQGGKEIARVPFRMRVAAAEVPAERTLRVTNWFRVDDRHARQFWGAPQFSDAWWPRTTRGSSASSTPSFPR